MLILLISVKHMQVCVSILSTQSHHSAARCSMGYKEGHNSGVGAGLGWVSGGGGRDRGKAGQRGGKRASGNQERGGVRQDLGARGGIRGRGMGWGGEMCHTPGRCLHNRLRWSSLLPIFGWGCL